MRTCNFQLITSHFLDSTNFVTKIHNGAAIFSIPFLSFYSTRYFVWGPGRLRSVIAQSIRTVLTPKFGIGEMLETQIFMTRCLYDQHLDASIQIHIYAIIIVIQISGTPSYLYITNVRYHSLYCLQRQTQSCYSYIVRLEKTKFFYFFCFR